MSSSEPISKDTFVYYRYNPTLVGAIIFCALFFIVGIIHGIRLTQTRTWYFIPMMIGAVMEGIGYTGRIMSHYNQDSRGPYIIQALFLLISPALFAASIYMVLGRLIVHTGAERHSSIRVNWLTKIFVSGDVLSFLMQGSGGGVMAGGSADSMKTGEHMVIGGLGVQIIFFSVFLAAAILFHIRINREPTEKSLELQRTGPKGWMTLLKALYVGSAFILIRSIFRVVEYVQGNSGYLMRNELWLYVFDSVLMLKVILLFYVVYPSRVIPPQDKSPSTERERFGDGGGRSERGIGRK